MPFDVDRYKASRPEEKVLLATYKEAYQGLLEFMRKKKTFSSSSHGQRYMDLALYENFYAALIKGEESQASHRFMMAECGSNAERIQILENLCSFIQGYSEIKHKAVREFKLSFYETLPYKRTLVTYLFQSGFRDEGIALLPSLFESYRDLIVSLSHRVDPDYLKESSQDLSSVVVGFFLGKTKLQKDKFGLKKLFVDAAGGSDAQKLLSSVKDMTKLLISAGKAYVELEQFSLGVEYFEHADMFARLYQGGNIEAFDELGRGGFREFQEELLSAKVRRDALTQEEDLTDVARGESRDDRLNTLQPAVSNALYDRSDSSHQKAGSEDQYVENQGACSLKGSSMFFSARLGTALLAGAKQAKKTEKKGVSDGRPRLPLPVDSARVENAGKDMFYTPMVFKG